MAQILLAGGGSISNILSAQVMRGNGHAVTISPDAADTLDFIQTEQFDLIILDFSNYSDKDAISILKTISRSTKTQLFLIDVYTDSKLFKNSDKYGVVGIFQRADLSDL